MLCHNEGVEPVHINSRINRWLALAVWALAATVGAAALVGDNLVVLPTLAFASLAAWYGLWLPGFDITDDGLLVRNVLHRSYVPWSALVHVSTKYALTLHTPNGEVPVFAAPQPGRFAALRAKRAARRAGDEVHGVRPGDLLGTESGDAAAVVRDRWDRLRRQGSITAGDAEDFAVVRTRHTTAIAALALAAAVALIASALLA